MRRDDLLKCLESLEVDKETAEEFANSIQCAVRQMQQGSIRISHPSLLKLKYLLEEMFGSLAVEYNKILTSSSYSSPKTQAFQDLNDALQIQIDKTRQLLREK